MLSRNTLNPADITVLYRNYSAADPPPIDLIYINIYIYIYKYKIICIYKKTMKLIYVSQSKVLCYHFLDILS